MNEPRPLVKTRPKLPLQFGRGACILKSVWRTTGNPEREDHRVKILLVIDQFDADNNGTTISARRFAQALENHGNEVRVVSTGEEREGKYAVREWKIPFFDGLVKSQGMCFGRPDKKTLEEAIRWADVVHFPMPFALSFEGEKIASELGVPRTAAFHVQPENITSSIHMGNVRSLSTGIYRAFKKIFYDKFTHIHCPSEFIAGQLRKNGYKAKLHVISNGIDPAFVYRKQPKRPEFEGKLVVLMVGRLSVEKRQDVLIDAVAKSKYADRIQLVLAGQGPRRAQLLERAQKLKHPPVVDFFPKDDLLDLMAESDLYVHAADIEIEAISCMEAFAAGLVPVIANSDRSATPQFALDERSLFVAGDSDDLARKMDYWFDHPEERAEREKQYAEQGKRYRIDRCVVKMEEMFREAMAEQPPRQDGGGYGDRTGTVASAAAPVPAAAPAPSGAGVFPPIPRPAPPAPVPKVWQPADDPSEQADGEPVS